LRHLSLLTLFLLAFAQTGCGEEKATAEPAAQLSQSQKTINDGSDAETVIALDGAGLRMVNSETGSARLMAFGTERAAAESAIAKQLGAVVDRSSNGECGAGPMEFSSFGDLVANFQDDRFVGWRLRGGNGQEALTTLSGVGIGTKRSEMARSVTFDIYEDSSIGTEFHTGGDAGFSGLLSSEAPDARITDLWAGTNCIFR
jgi:hypothetical protein